MKRIISSSLRPAQQRVICRTLVPSLQSSTPVRPLRAPSSSSCIPAAPAAVSVRSMSSASAASSSSSVYVPTAAQANAADRVTAAAIIDAWRRPYTPGTLTPAELEQFWNDGYVVAKNLFTKQDLAPAFAAIEVLVDQMAEKLYRPGKIKDKCSSLGVYQRLTAIDKQFPGASVLLHKQGVLPEAFSTLWSSKQLLDTAQQILGPDIVGHPVWNLRTKIPRSEQVTVPWHQDAAYLEPIASRTLQLTAWLPFIDANLHNGTMQIIRGGHRSGLIASHQCCAGNTWYAEVLPETLAKELGSKFPEDVVTVEVPMGSALMLNNVVPHCSLENYSDMIRWSIDLRWQRPNDPSGFFGIKDPIVMRTSANPNHKTDWVKWAAAGRHQIAEEKGNIKIDEFDTTISGAWMERWPIVHHNKHTRAYRPDGGKWGASYTQKA